MLDLEFTQCRIELCSDQSIIHLFYSCALKTMQMGLKVVQCQHISIKTAYKRSLCTHCLFLFAICKIEKQTNNNKYFTSTACDHL